MFYEFLYIFKLYLACVTSSAAVI